MTDPLQRSMRTNVVITLWKTLEEVRDYRKVWKDKLCKEEKEWLDKAEQYLVELLRPFGWIREKERDGRGSE